MILNSLKTDFGYPLKIHHSIIKKIKRGYLRRLMRGYRLLKQNDQLDRISLVKQALTEQKLSLTSKLFTPYLLGAGYLEGEIVVRQYLLVRIGGLGLNQALLHALGKMGGKVIFPLPKEWRLTISKYGFDVANVRSSILWQLYIFGTWLYGVLQIAKVIFSGFKSLIHRPKNSKKYVYFANLSKGNLPHGIHGQKSYDIVSWYLQWSGRSQDFQAIHHSVPNVSNRVVDDVELIFQAQMLPSLMGWRAIGKYAVWAIGACFITLLDCLRARWWHALLLNQSALSALVRLLPKTTLACEYLFHNSGWIYRPLWTYDAEKVGSKITFYFYSTNCENLKTPEAEESIPYGWKAMTWPRYLVWDQYQYDFIRKSVGQYPVVLNVGIIWFQDHGKKFSMPKGKMLTIFDVTPYRDLIYVGLGLNMEFYVPQVVNKFLQDILDASSQFGWTVAYKNKRNIGRSAHPNYRSFLKDMQSLANVNLIDPEVSALSVIMSSDVVISLPFTSTALIAKSLGKSSYYYDPTGSLQNGESASHGVRIINNTQLMDVLRDHGI